MTIERALEVARPFSHPSNPRNHEAMAIVTIIEELTKPCDSLWHEARPELLSSSGHCPNNCIDGRVPIGESE